MKRKRLPGFVADVAKRKRVFDTLTKAGMMADWREPNVIRIAPVPLYNSFEEVWQFANILRQILKTWKMTRKQIIEQIRKKHSYLCVGLDTDITKIPQHLLSAPDPVFEFNKSIIDATKELCVATRSILLFMKPWD